MLEPDKLIIELWPSIEEIHTSRMKNEYKGRLTEFYESLESLFNDLRSAQLSIEPFTDDKIEKGESAARAFPPEVVELVAWLGSSGIALALYKALKLWVDYKNGRRIKIVDGSLEVEATQLSKQQFSELLDVVHEHRKKLSPTDKVQQALNEKGFMTRFVDDNKRLEERRILKKECAKKKEIPMPNQANAADS